MPWRTARGSVPAAGCTSAGAALLLAIVLAWLAPALLVGGPDYTHELLGQKAVGYVANSQVHAQPFYYFIELAPGLLLPWTLLLAPAVWLAVSHRREEDGGPPLFALVWLVATYAFFSCISAKRFAYVLPASPAIGMLVGWCLSGGVLERHGGWQRAAVYLARVTAGALGLVFAAGMAAVLLYPERLAAVVRVGADALGPRWQAGALVLLALPLAFCVAAWLWAGRRLPRCVPALALAVVLGGVWVDLSVVPLLNADQSVAPFCREIDSHLRDGERFYLYSVDFSGAVNLYTDRTVIPTLTGAGALRAALRDPDALILSDLKRFDNVLTRKS